jgi:hypothetical protein
VAAGQFPSRREAFLDYARRALRARQPDVPENCTPQSLARELFEYAESSEHVGL